MTTAAREQAELARARGADVEEEGYDQERKQDPCQQRQDKAKSARQQFDAESARRRSSGICGSTWPGRRRGRSRPSRTSRRICEEHLAGKYSIEVVDLLKNPQLARGDQILAVPTLVRKLPEPVRKIIGDLSNTERVLVGLDLRPR